MIDHNVDAQLLTLMVCHHTIGVLQLIDFTFDKIDAAIFSFKIIDLINRLGIMLIIIGLKYIHGKLYLPIHFTIFLFLWSWHCEKTNFSRSWLVPRGNVRVIWPVSRLKSQAPHHSIMTLENATLNIVSNEILIRPIEKHMRLHIMDYPKK